MKRIAVNPWEWSKQYQFNQGEILEGVSRQLVCSGQTAIDAEGKVQHPDDLRGQITAAMNNQEAVLFARSLWTTESESSTGSFARSHDRPAGDENSTLPFFGMTRTHRVRRSYDHRLRDAIAATGNADLFRDVAIPASTRRTWVRGEVRPVVASVDVELEVYELLEAGRQSKTASQGAGGDHRVTRACVEVPRGKTRRRSPSRMVRPNRRCSGRSRRRVVSCR